MWMAYTYNGNLLRIPTIRGRIVDVIWESTKISSLLVKKRYSGELTPELRRFRRIRERGLKNKTERSRII